MGLAMKSSADAHQLIKISEGLFLTAYRCPAGVWTIGWGHTKGVKPGMRISMDEAERLFREDVAEFDAGVSRLLTREVPQYVFDALVSFAWNVGLDEDSDTKPEGLGDSSLLRYVNAGQMDRAADEFGKWVWVFPPGKPKKRERGLVIRRRREVAMFGGFDWRLVK